MINIFISIYIFCDIILNNLSGTRSITRSLNRYSLSHLDPYNLFGIKRNKKECTTLVLTSGMQTRVTFNGRADF